MSCAASTDPSPVMPIHSPSQLKSWYKLMPTFTSDAFPSCWNACIHMLISAWGLHARPWSRRQQGLTTVQARNKSRSAAAAASAMVGNGYNSDEDVYNTAENMDRALGTDAPDSRVPDGRRKLEPLPPLDHSSITYQDFTKDLYQEHAEVANLTPAEVCVRWVPTDTAKPGRSQAGAGQSQGSRACCTWPRSYAAALNTVPACCKAGSGLVPIPAAKPRTLPGCTCAVQPAVAASALAGMEEA